LAQTLTLKRYATASRDASGNPAAPTATTLGTRTGCIQPVSAELRESIGGIVENADDITHHGFIETRLSGLQIKDRVVDAGGTQYIITFLHDFGGSTPQQLDLRIIDDLEATT
jgi:hypothetical protein